MKLSRAESILSQLTKFVTLCAFSIAINSKAATIEETVATNCEKPQTVVQSPLAIAIEELIGRYSDVQKRVSDSSGYIFALDKVIQASSFAHILKCRETLNRTTNSDYAIEFLPIDDPGNIQVLPAWVHTPWRGKVTLRMHLGLPPEGAIFGYLHELTHVCQQPKEQELRRQISILPGFGKSQREIHSRYRILGEIEAFRNMMLAYAELTAATPAVCRISSQPNTGTPLYQSLTPILQLFGKGMFAQRFINSYRKNNPYSYSWFLKNSPPHEYVLHDTRFILPTLNPQLKIEIEELGISVVEP